eukprot:6939963-Alexandrium_andersonii.AAC.1
MSASLVGSEMCIRDSACAGCHHALQRSLSPGASPSAAGAWPQLSRTQCCLLYTSDAADDM